MHDSLQQILDLSLEAVHGHLIRGDLRQAADALDSIHLLASSTDPTVADRAIVNAASVTLELGLSGIPIDRLRRVLTAGRDSITTYIASHVLSRHYFYGNRPKHATFYAQIANANAPRNHSGTARHLLGILRLAQSDVRHGLEDLSFACDNWAPKQAPLELGLSALAYANALLGRRAQATCLADQANLNDCSFPLYACEIHLNLGFAYFEVGLLEAAQCHARRSLALARVTPSHEHKLALYLAGESSSAMGDRDAGLAYFRELCMHYYPQLDLLQMLVAVRTSPMVNWLT